MTQALDLSAAIATAAQYRAALLEFRDGCKEKEVAAAVRMLRAHCRADNHTVTARTLAAAVGLPDYNDANLQYGKVAAKIAGVLGYEPPKTSKGRKMCWRALSTNPTGAQVDEDGHFEWVMRPELVEALTDMRWA